MKSLLLNCSCYSHVLKLIWDEDGFLFIEILPAKMHFWERVKYLFFGKDYCIGEVVLAENEINLLKEFLEDLYERAYTNEN